MEYTDEDMDRYTELERKPAFIEFSKVQAILLAVLFVVYCVGFYLLGRFHACPF